MNSLNPVYKKTQKVTNNETALFVLITLITLIISLITSVFSIIVYYKFGLISNTKLIKFNENSTSFQNDYSTNKILIKDGIILNDLKGNFLLETPNTKLKIDSNKIDFYAKKEISVYSKSNKKIFPPDFNKIVFKPISNLEITNGIQNVNKIRSPIDQSLQILNKNYLTFQGNNGLNIDGKHINFISQRIYLNSMNSTLDFNSNKGDIYLLLDLKKENSNLNLENTDLDEEKYQYKLCICGKSGLIFKLKIKNNTTKCIDVRFPVSSNPCEKHISF